MFCGKTRKRGKEHAFAETLLDALEANREKAVLERRSVADDSSESQRSHPFGTLVCGDVCEACNIGWMSKMEQSVRTWILGINSKDDLKFPSDSFRLLFSRWALKTACILDRLGTLNEINPEISRQLHDAPDRLPERIAVFIGFLDYPGKKLFAWNQRNAWTEYPLDTKCTSRDCSSAGSWFKIAFAIGPLMILVASTPNDHFKFAVGSGVHVAAWPAVEYRLRNWFYTRRVDSVDPVTALKNFSDLLAVSHEGQVFS